MNLVTEGFSLVTAVLGVAGIGGILGMLKIVHHMGKVDEGRARDINEIRADITKINLLLNNGGLVKELKTLQINCAGAMNSVVSRLNNHIDSTGHGTTSVQIAGLEARVKILEHRQEVD